MLGVRPFKECDLESIAKWITDEKAFYCWSLGDFGEYSNVKEQLSDFIREKANDVYTYHLVGTNQEGPIGFITVQENVDISKNIVIKHVVLEERYKSKGFIPRFLKILSRFAYNVLKANSLELQIMCEEGTDREIEVPGFLVRAQRGDTYEFGNRKYFLKKIYISVPSNESEQLDKQEADYAVKEIIDSNGFKYAYQPIVDAKTGEIYAYEALMRAEYEGRISPLTILDYAARKNRLYDIEKATFFNVLSNINDKKELFGDRLVFINSLPGNLLKVEDFEELERKYGELFKNVIVEITEATELSEQELETVLERSKESGFGVAIDDYGTGYSNTTNLLRYVPSCVKIDKLLITNIHQDAKKQHFVNSLISFAHDNGFKVLAEGVETLAECRYVVQVGVDLIQGFYTARPSFEVIDEIDASIRQEILSANVREQTLSDRKIYHVHETESRIPVMRLALEQYTGIVVSNPKIQIIGNSNYAASMNIKIKDGAKCQMILRDVMLESFQELPCIELGENVELTLTIVGNCNFRKVGIRVPATSKLILDGPGNLEINAKGIRSYGIGSGWESEVGEIVLAGSGRININVEAEYAIALGGGIAANEQGIKVMSGNLYIDLASANSIGIGFVRGNSKILLVNANIDVIMNSENGTAIGVLEEKGDITIRKSTIKISGAGNSVTGVGSPEEYGADIVINESTLEVSMNGSKVLLLGVQGGNVNVSADSSIINLRGEGSEITGVGSRRGDGHIYAKDTVMNVNIRSGKYVVLGAAKKNISFDGGSQHFVANE